MKTFHQFIINEAPATPPTPTSPSGGPGGPPATPPGGLGGSLGPSMPLGAPSPLGAGLPPAGPGPSLGGPPSIDPSMGGPSPQGTGQVSSQKIVVSNVWQALEKIIKNKNGQKDKKVINSEEI